jgi:hypothetical protein
MIQRSLMVRLGLGLWGLMCLAAGPAGPAAASSSAEGLQVLADRTLVTFPDPSAERQLPEANIGPVAHRWVVLPWDARHCEITRLNDTETDGSPEPVAIQWLRGRPVICVSRGEAAGMPSRVEIKHDGHWALAPERARRLGSRAFTAMLEPVLGTGKSATVYGEGGSYVIITPDVFVPAVAPLADWKQRKGWPVTVATTGSIGTDSGSIKAWLCEAYETWPQPPEYVLLVGDVADVPTWTFSGNVSDLPYACLDGDDWLPDVMVGRFSVASITQLEAVVAKSVDYERHPYRQEGDGWFTRSLMVAGNYASTTPYATILWCGQQLESIGFAPAAGVYYAPPWHQYWDGYDQIIPILEEGVSLVAYRGWALGISGWQPPTFTVDHIPAVANGAKTPVVMSFVCHTGDFGNADPCFGEVFLRQGAAGAPKGAVAFIGNGEHWSTTRFNDAMAYSFFERIVDPGLNDLGCLITAGKLRFCELFPLELEASDHGEASVEFYFHIYNLLGDPELPFWKATPETMVVQHPATLPAGCNYLEVTVRDQDAVTLLEGARVGAVQSGTLLGCGFSDETGVARLSLSTVQGAGAVAVTVTHPQKVPYEGMIASGDGGAAFLALDGWSVDDDAEPPSQGNGDGRLNPGETVAITPTLTNRGAAIATDISVDLSGGGPVTIRPGTVGCGDLPGGGTAAASEPFLVSVSPAAVDRTVILCQLTASHSASPGDVSPLTLTITAPQLVAEPVPMSPDGQVHPGQPFALALSLRNTGSEATAGGTARLSVVDPNLATVTDAVCSFGPLAPGAILSTLDDPFALEIAAGLAAGTGLACTLQFSTQEGYELQGSLALTVGQVDIGAPTGPDAYGYYAYDSADTDYPAAVPVYRWTELSPTYGGNGQLVPFPLDALLPLRQLPFHFRFYGQPVDSIRISDNGWISFDTRESYDWWNLPLPHPYGNGAIVAPFWDNFDPTLPGTDGIYTAYDAGAGTFTVQWSRMRNIMPEIDDWQSFQVVLLDPASHPTPTGDGEILFLYKQVTNSDYLESYASAGIEDASEQRGLQLTYSNVYAAGAAPLSDGLAVKITTAVPVYQPFSLANMTMNGKEEGVLLSWRPSDERPIQGWRLLRQTGDLDAPVFVAELAAAARSHLDSDASAAEPCSYLLIALHPCGRQTRLGPYVYAPDTAGIRVNGLWPCSPNPVQESTTIRFALPLAGHARLRIYDLTGRCIRTLRQGRFAEGPGSALWDGRDDGGRRVAGGVYFYRLETENGFHTRKLLLVR